MKTPPKISSSFLCLVIQVHLLQIIKFHLGRLETSRDVQDHWYEKRKFHRKIKKLSLELLLWQKKLMISGPTVFFRWHVTSPQGKVRMLVARHIFGQSYLLVITEYHLAPLFTRKSSTPYLAPYEDVILMEIPFWT